MKRGRVFRDAVLPPLVTLLVLLAGWEGLVRALSVPFFLVPPPSAVFATFAHDSSLLLGALATTAKAALFGFLLSALVGTLLGIILSTSRVIERGLYPYTLFLQTVPIVAVAPLLVLWFGVGFRAVAVSAFIVSVFPVIANTLAGLRSVDPGLSDLFKLYRASRLQTLVKLQLPSALPNVFTGLRIASGLATIGAIVGEFVAGFSEGGGGLGITVLAAYRQLRTDLLFAAVLSAAALGLALFGAVSLFSTLALHRRLPRT